MKRNVLSGLIGGCAALSLLISGAFAVAYDSSTVSYTVGDMTYSGWSTLYVDGGSINKTIQVSERGSYTLAIRNNSSSSVRVVGFVNY